MLALVCSYIFVFRFPHNLLFSHASSKFFKLIGAFFCWRSFICIGHPAQRHVGMYSWKADRLVIYLWTISASNFFLKFRFYEWHEFLKRLGAIPHLPQHDAVTVDICCLCAILQVLQYFRCNINNAFLCFLKFAHDSNISYHCCVMLIHLEQNIKALNMQFLVG